MNLTEFLHSRAFRIYLAISLGAALLAFLIALIVGLSLRPEPRQLPREDLLADGSGLCCDPESIILPEAWSLPVEIAPLLSREYGQSWSYERIRPFWYAPEELEYRSLREECDEAVRVYLDSLP